MALVHYSGGIVVTDRDPTALDDQTNGYNINTIWRNSDTGQLFMSSDDSENEAVWNQLVVLPADAAAYDLLFLGSDGSTVDTLAIGTAAQVLAVNATADGYVWVANV